MPLPVPVAILSIKSALTKHQGIHNVFTTGGHDPRQHTVQTRKYRFSVK